MRQESLRKGLGRWAMATVAAIAVPLAQGSDAAGRVSGFSGAVSTDANPVLRAAAHRSQQGASASDRSASQAVLTRYCVTCHSQRLRTAGLVLEGLDLDRIPANAEVWEKVVAKLRGGAMPPAGAPRPDKAAHEGLTGWIESALDRAAAAEPTPGRRILHRLNRVEYANVIRDLLALEINSAALLPPDDTGYGFDNIADVLTVSPGLLERYLAAARRISRQALGDPTIRPATEKYTTAMLDRQEERASEDLPFGTRGGIAIRRHFPVDGEYVLRIVMRRPSGSNNTIVGIGTREDIEVRIDGERVKQFTFGGNDGPERASVAFGDASGQFEVRLPIKAGPRIVGVTFPQSALEREDLRPHIPTSNYSFLDDRRALARIDTVEIDGPYNASGAEESPTRRILVCRPTSPAEEEPCAKRILSTLARRAYRRPVTGVDIQPLLNLYQAGRREGDFDAGIQAALERLLVSPHFLFRAERDPASVGSNGVHRISDIDLASRLSFFLWSSIPDDELLGLAEKGRLSDPTVVAQQVQRMLRDPRSAALTDNFAGQWLFLRNLEHVRPDQHAYPDFDDELRAAFRTETELLFRSQVREDRSVVDLLNADYTFVNARLARHYGIPNVYGSHFRRIVLSDKKRVGLLGHASILTVTSYANRTSPVLRGKWILENILGSPPPAPPANVPALDEAKPGTTYRSMRERMEQHRKNPACALCHSRIDPLGFAMENFDGIGQWRTQDGGSTIDTSGALPDGTKFNGPVELRDLLLNRRREFVTLATTKLLTYALGRGVEYYDMPAVRRIVQDAAARDYRWSAIIDGIVSSTPFQMRRSQ